MHVLLAVLRVAGVAGVVGALGTLGALAGCRELVQPQPPQYPASFAAGVVLTTAGTYAAEADVELTNWAYVPWNERRSWQGRTNSDGEFVSELPAGQTYDVWVGYPSGAHSTVSSWKFVAVAFDDVPQILLPISLYQICRVHLPAELGADIGDGGVRLWYRMPVLPGEFRNVSSYSSRMDASGVCSVALPWPVRCLVEATVYLPTGSLSYAWADSFSASLTDTLDLFPAIVPFTVHASVHGEPELSLPVRLYVETYPSRSSADDMRFDFHTYSGRPIIGWGMPGPARLSVARRLQTPIFPWNGMVAIEAGISIDAELGRHRIAVQVLTDSGGPAAGASVAVARAYNDFLGSDANVDGVVSFYLNPGTYTVSAELDQLAVDAVITVDADLETTLQLPPPAPILGSATSGAR